MPKRVNEQNITDTESKKWWGQIDIANAITDQEVKEILEDPIESKDSTDGLGDTIKEIFQPILDELKDLSEEKEGKKSFIGGLIKIFTILLSLRATSLSKI